MIREGQLQEGEKLPPEPQLSAMFGVGRSSIREAVKSLIGLGVIEMRPGRGAYVRRLSLDDLVRMVDGAIRLEYGAALQLHEVRAMVEITAARLAAIRRTDADLETMREAILRYKFVGHSGQPDRLIDADLALHEAIVVAAHNDVLVTVLQSIRGLLREHRRQYGVAGEVAARPLVIAEHEEIFAAITAGDPRRAATRMQEHMRIIWRQIEEFAVRDGDSTLASQAYLPMYDDGGKPPA
jgi:GntR family transcriptional repressor for pyruvate dehydrogenase complex